MWTFCFGGFLIYSKVRGLFLFRVGLQGILTNAFDVVPYFLVESKILRYSLPLLYWSIIGFC